MFSRLPARATFVSDTNFVSGTQKMFLILFRNILCPQQMFPSLRSPRNIIGNNVSATMCPRLPGPLGFWAIFWHSDRGTVRATFPLVRMLKIWKMAAVTCDLYGLCPVPCDLWPAFCTCRVKPMPGPNWYHGCTKQLFSNKHFPINTLNADIYIFFKKSKLESVAISLRLT